MLLLKTSTRALLPVFRNSCIAVIACSWSWAAQAEPTTKTDEISSVKVVEPTIDTATIPATTEITAISDPFLPCTNTLNYRFFYKDNHVGNIQRKQIWEGKRVKMSTTGDVSFLMFDFTGKHQSQIYWNANQQQFLTREFIQDVQGLSRTQMTATFSDNGLLSKVVLNGEALEFSDLHSPILDFEAISMQMRQNLMDKKTSFDFVMQRSDEVSHYYFDVIGEESVEVMGKRYQTIKVQQVKKKDRKLYFWFAPDLDYQLVKSTYKRKIIDIEANLSKLDLGCSKTPKAAS